MKKKFTDSCGMTKAKSIFVLLFSIFSFQFSIVSSAQKHVDLYRTGTFFNTYSSIKAAVSAANATGDSLVLSAQTFYEDSIVAYNKTIQYQGTITSTDSTIIDGGGRLQYILYAGPSGSVRDIIFQNGRNGLITFYNGMPGDVFIVGGNTIIRNFNDSSAWALSMGARNSIVEGNTKIINNSLRSVFANNPFIKLTIKDNVLIAPNSIHKCNYWLKNNFAGAIKLSFFRGLLFSLA